MTVRKKINARRASVDFPILGEEHKRESEALLDSLTEMFERDGESGSGFYEQDLTPFLYSSIPLPNNEPTGGEVARTLLSGTLDPCYSLPRDEILFLLRNEPVLAESFRPISSKQAITYVSLGCGPSTAIEQKDIRIVRALGASRYIGLDLNPNYAQFAAAQIKATMPNVQTDFMVASFTDPFTLAPYAKDSQIVLGMMGDTIGQFPIIKDNADESTIKGVTLKKLMDNLSAATDGKAIMLATTDEENCAGPLESKYHGECMRRMMNTLWRTVQVVTRDAAFDPKNFSYRAVYDEDLSAIKFRLVNWDPMTLTVRGKTYKFPRNSKFHIGCSQKLPPEALMPTITKTGWTTYPLKSPTKLVSSTRLMALAGPQYKAG